MNTTHFAVSILLISLGLPPLQVRAKSSAELGYRYLTQDMSAGSVTLMISQEEWLSLPTVWPVPLQKKLLQYPTRGSLIALERYGFSPQSMEKNLEYAVRPIPFVAHKEKWEANCLLCHANAIPTWNEELQKTDFRTFIGAPNSQLNLGQFFKDRMAVAQTGRGQSGKWYSALFPKFYTFLVEDSGIHIDQGVGAVSPWIGEALYLQLRTKRFNTSWRQLLKAMRDFKSLNLYGVDSRVVADPPAWWASAHKTRLYADGFAPFTSRTVSQSIDAPFINVKKHQPEIENLVAYIKQVKAPRFPKSKISFAGAATGAMLFSQNCSKCHGTYSSEGEVLSYPDRRVDIDVIGTDSARLEVGLTIEFRKAFSESWLGDYGNASIDVSPEGYQAPPLNGIWASAPYFHNGSVPTLYDLLFSDQRPEIWRKDFSKYDWTKAGLTYTSLNVEDPTDSSIYNTSKFSMGNQGHRFQDSLSSSQKLALLEYLKTL